MSRLVSVLLLFACMALTTQALRVSMKKPITVTDDKKHKAWLRLTRVLAAGANGMVVAATVGHAGGGYPSSTHGLRAAAPSHTFLDELVTSHAGQDLIIKVHNPSQKSVEQAHQEKTTNACVRDTFAQTAAGRNFYDQHIAKFLGSFIGQCINSVNKNAIEAAVGPITPQKIDPKTARAVRRQLRDATKTEDDVEADVDTSAGKICLYTVFENAGVTTLQKLIEEDSIDTPALRADIITQFATMVNTYLTAGFVHADLHAGNVMARPKPGGAAGWDLAMIDLATTMLTKKVHKYPAACATVHPAPTDPFLLSDAKDLDHVYFRLYRNTACCTPTHERLVVLAQARNAGTLSKAQVANLITAFAANPTCPFDTMIDPQEPVVNRKPCL